MPPIISFIGWHNSGKTTLARKVVRLLKERGYRIAVVKSTKETGIPFNPVGTDTHNYLLAGADSVTLIAPDQIATFAPPTNTDLRTIAAHQFAHMDLVVAEGFKRHPDIQKIEVAVNNDSPLFLEVPGVVAVAADIPVQHSKVFSRDQIALIADYIIDLFKLGPLSQPNSPQAIEK